MKEKDIVFFKIISVLIFLVLSVGVGSYIKNNYVSQKDKNSKLINDMGLDNKTVEELEKIKQDLD